MSRRRFAVCDFCGAHSTRLQACAACKAVSYCNRDCQRQAWTSHHRIECSPNSKIPCSFREAAACVRPTWLTYEAYLLLIDAFAHVDERQCTSAGFKCPLRAVAVAAALLDCKERCAKRVRVILSEARALFRHMTHALLPDTSPCSWRNARSSDGWEREAGDNSRLLVDTVHHVTTTAQDIIVIDCRADRSANPPNELVTIVLDSCACCSAYTSLAAIIDNRSCLFHSGKAPQLDGGDLCRIDILRDLDVFSMASLVEYSRADTPTKAGACECVCAISPNDVLSTSSSSTRLAVVRLTTTTGILDIVAVTPLLDSCNEPCEATLAVLSPVFYDKCVL